MKRLKDEDNEEGKKKEEEEEEVDDAIVVGVSDAVLDTVKRLKCKARARNFYISGVVVEKRMAKPNAETKKFIEHTEHKKLRKGKIFIIKSLVSANNGEENEESRYVNHIEG